MTAWPRKCPSCGQQTGQALPGGAGAQAEKPGPLAAALRAQKDRDTAERLGLVAPGHRAAVVVREHDDRLPVQFQTENPFARGEEIVAVGKDVHGQLR